MSRTVVWWSAGAASSVAALLTTRPDIAAMFPNVKADPDAMLVYTDPGSEHPDNHRFRADVERWLGRPVTVLRSTEYVDTWDVWERTGWINGDGGARCTVELKKRLRQQFEQPDDVQVFGYTADELVRVERFRQANPEVNISTPLIDAGLTKQDCLGVLVEASIELPAMYRLGYRNANCVGCPHGGMGYWNMIRRDFPDVFDRMARLERRSSKNGEPIICRPGGEGVWLDELEPGRGDIHTEPDIECSLFCASMGGAQ